MPAGAIQSEITEALRFYGYEYRSESEHGDHHIWVPIMDDERGADMGISIFCDDGVAWGDGDWVHFEIPRKFKFEVGFGMKFVKIMTEAIAKTFSKNIEVALSST